MKSFKSILTVGAAVLALVFASGCTTMEDRLAMASVQKEVMVAEAQRDTAKYNAETARYKAIAFTTIGGGETSKAVAAMSLQKGGESSVDTKAKTGSSTINFGPSTAEQAFMWTDMLLNRGSNFYQIKKGADVSIVQSNNNRDVSLGNQRTYVDLVREARPVYNNSFNTVPAAEPAPVE